MRVWVLCACVCVWVYLLGYSQLQLAALPLRVAWVFYWCSDIWIMPEQSKWDIGASSTYSRIHSIESRDRDREPWNWGTENRNRNRKLKTIHQSVKADALAPRIVRDKEKKIIKKIKTKRRNNAHPLDTVAVADTDRYIDRDTNRLQCWLWTIITKDGWAAKCLQCQCFHRWRLRALVALVEFALMDKP